MLKAQLKQLSGNTLINDDLTLGFTRDQMLTVFSYIRELVDTGTVPTFEEAVPYENVYADQNPEWLNGKLGIFSTNSSLIPGIEKASPFALGALRYPVSKDAVDPGILVAPSMFFTVYKESKHQEVAADVINFLLNDPEAIRILGDTRGIPCNAKALDLLVKEQKVSALVSQMVNQAMTGAAKAENSPSLNSEVIALMKENIQFVGYKKMTPEVATDAFTQELLKLVETLN
jgi:oligogalacturonide transport system substrate-binding protein